MRFDPDATVNPGRFLSALVIEELRRHGLGLVVMCPGARNQSLLGALSVRQDIDRVIAVDERAAGHLALGWLRGRAAVGLPPALAAVVTTSGSAPLLLAPALAEAQAAALPLVLLSADRPAELHGVGANQALDQLTPLRPLVAAQKHLDCFAGGMAPRNLLGAVAETATVALGPPGGPVQLNLAFREPLAPDPAPLPDGWTDDVADWAGHPMPFADAAPSTRWPDDAAVARLRDALQTARRPVIWVAGLEHAADRHAALALCASAGAPWIADAGSGLRLAPEHPHRLMHASRVRERLAAADLVVQLGRRPISLPLGKTLATAPRWVVDDHPERQDPWRQGGLRLHTSPAALLAALGDEPLATRPEPVWLAELLAADRAWRSRLAERIDAGDELSEAWLARELGRRLGHGTGLLLGNSLAVRHVDTLADCGQAGPITMTSRGTSGIEGLVAQAAGAARGLRTPTVALLGDLTVLHDLGSLALAARVKAPLLVVAIQNAGGAIFRQLPGGRHDALLDPWLLADQATPLADVAGSLGLVATRAADREAVLEAIDAFIAAPRPALLEVMVAPDGHVRLLDRLAEGGAP
jgi:2-succinyl-5-enolpyruvyl-6-hydroxy-3-cyclohexene-1-carboxylate synthase